MCPRIHQATHLLFKYYISKLGGASRLALTMLTQWGVSKIWENLLM